MSRTITLPILLLRFAHIVYLIYKYVLDFLNFIITMLYLFECDILYEHSLEYNIQ